jgi:hypothetical protein
MAKIPENTVTQDDLNKWSQLQTQLGLLKAEEALLRSKIFKAAFPNPVEGTNTYPLSQGWVLKATYPISRKCDVASLVALAPELREAGIKLEDVVRYKPELAVGEYKKLTDEQRHLFDRVLEIKPGSPQMEILLPKRAVVAA